MTTEGVDAVVVTVETEPVDADAVVRDLFAQEGAALVRLAGIFCDDRDAAEDLVQEAFIRLHRSAGSIRDMSRAPAFLRSIVINLARDHNRRGLVSFRHRGSAVVPRPTPEPGERTVADEEAAAVLDALGLLPDRQRACLVLHYYLDQTIAEVADTLDISPNSVKTHCRRGLASLEQHLEGSR